MKEQRVNFGRKKVFLNGYEYWLDSEKQVFYDKEESTDGISIWSNHVTKDERRQLLDYIKYVR